MHLHTCTIYYTIHNIYSVVAPPENTNNSLCEQLNAKEISILQDLDQAQADKYSLYKDKIRVKWMNDGHRNSSFLHSLDKVHWAKSLCAIEIEGI